MSHAQQPSVTAAHAEPPPSLGRRVFSSTGQPPAWALVRYLVAGVVAGVALGSALPHIKGTLLSALAGAIVAASASFFAAYLVLLTPGKTPRSLASVRVASTVFGVLLLAVASVILPNEVLFSFGIVILFVGVGIGPPYPIIGGGLTSIGSILMAGAPTGAIGTWSTHRLLDTIVGCAIALVANYLLWPRDTEAHEAPPVADSAPAPG